MIKIIAILNNSIGAGGGFDQALNAILQMQRLSVNRFGFEVFTTVNSNLAFLNRLGVQATAIKITIFDRLLAKISPNTWWQDIQSRIKLVGPLEKKLVRHGCDVVYFITPGSASSGLQKLNFITTVWDLCHRETPEFPEVRNYNTFFVREKYYQNNLGSALLILTDSQRLADIASHHYGIERDRLLAMPFAPSPLLDEAHSLEKDEVLKKYRLESDYFFYPAQFWAHKNHIRILQALLYLRERHDWVPKVVFSGKDHGNLGYVQKFIKVNKLEAQVNILGFVPSEDMRGLYENAVAVVMPTYFGPTNLPPLEAWALGKPLIYSAHLAEQTGNAALLVNPDDAVDLAKAMLLCTKPAVHDQLVESGKQRLADIEKQRSAAEDQLCIALDRFAARRQCWSEY